METLDGILIATTNLTQNMDKAFEIKGCASIRHKLTIPLHYHSQIREHTFLAQLFKSNLGVETKTSHMNKPYFNFDKIH